jgi:hypothetical protein
VKQPPPELAEIFQNAARATFVPWTLLAAVAYHESAYNPAAVGAKTRKGWRALGLMQLGPDVLAEQELSESAAMDAAKNCSAAARHLWKLHGQAGGSWERALAGYVLGWPQVATYEADKKRLPARVTEYAKVVIGNRRWLQAQVKPAGSTALERLARAIHGLAKANPSSDERVSLWKTFKGWYETAPANALSTNLLNLPVLQYHWGAYARLYEDAPITTDQTPRPVDIEPSLWDELLRRVPMTGDQHQMDLPLMQPNTRELVRRIEADGGGGSNVLGLVLVGVVLLMVMRNR